MGDKEIKMAMQGLEILKALYCPYLKEPLEAAVKDTETKIDDAIVNVVNIVMGCSDGSAMVQGFAVLKELYCPYLREPLLKAVENTGTPIDDAIFKVVDRLIGTC